jgi:hypothetical protein
MDKFDQDVVKNAAFVNMMLLMKLIDNYSKSLENKNKLERMDEK